MNDWCIELAAAVIRQAVWDLRLIATGKKKQIIEEYIKLGSYERAAEKFGIKKDSVRKTVIDDRIGQDAYEFLTGERLETWGKMTGLDIDYLRKEIARYSDLYKKYAVSPNIKD